MEHVNIYSIRSIEKLLVSMKGKMVRFGTDVRGKTPVEKIPELSKNKPALIVLGNEEHGISRTVRENCDERVTIPWQADFNPDEKQPIESLNVAQAAAIILYECRKLVK